MRKRLIVFEQNIITRFQPFNQLIFHQQSFSFVFNDNKLHTPNFRNHSLQTVRQLVDMRIGHNPFFDVLGFTDIQNLFVRANHPVNAGLLRRNLNVLL